MAETHLFHFIVALTVSTIGFLIFYFFTFTDFVKRLNLKNGEPSQIVYQRITGVVIFGLLPFILIVLSDSLLQEFGLVVPGKSTLIWASVLIPVIIVVNYINAVTPQNLAMYPQIRRREWDVKLIILSAGSWLLYILAYEFLFRGYLLFTAISIIGLWPAILLNIIIYSLVHFHKGIKEMIGSLPFGLLLCYLCYLTGSIWIAVIAHSTMVLSNEWFSIARNPELTVKKVYK